MATISVDPAALRVIDAGLVHALDLGADLMALARTVQTRTADPATAAIAAEAEALLANAVETGVEAARGMLLAADQYEVAGEAGGAPTGPQPVSFGQHGYDLSSPSIAGVAAPSGSVIDPSGVTVFEADSPEATGVWGGGAERAALASASSTSNSGGQMDLAGNQKATDALFNGPTAAAGGPLADAGGTPTSLLENASRGGLIHPDSRSR